MPSKEALNVRKKILEKNLEHCRSLTPQQVDTVIELSKEEKELSLLTIELEDENSIPKVFYKGEEITGRIHISFSWDTKDTYSQGGLSYAIENSGKDNIVNRIERRTKDHR